MSDNPLNKRELDRIENKLRSEIGMVDENHLKDAGQAIHQLRCRISELETDRGAIRQQRDEAWDRIEELESRLQWRPIRTRPREWYKQFLINTRAYQSGVQIVYWSPDKQALVDIEGDKYIDATHWMPLPNPPAEVRNAK